MTLPGPDARPPECWGELRGTTLRVRLAGAVDHTMEARFRELLAEATGRFERAVVDARQVTFFGAAGLNFLARLAATGATVQLLGSSELPLDRLLRAVGLQTRIRLWHVEAGRNGTAHHV